MSRLYTSQEAWGKLCRLAAPLCSPPSRTINSCGLICRLIAKVEPTEEHYLGRHLTGLYYTLEAEVKRLYWMAQRPAINRDRAGTREATVP